MEVGPLNVLKIGRCLHILHPSLYLSLSTKQQWQLGQAPHSREIDNSAMMCYASSVSSLTIVR